MERAGVQSAFFMVLGTITALVIDFWLVSWLRGHSRADEANPTVKFLGVYSPVLTWLRYGRSPAPDETWRGWPEWRLVVATRQRVTTSLVKVRAFITRWLGVMKVAVILGLAALPPTLVVRDRWLNDPSAANWLQSAWCQIDALCDLRLPPYFAAILAGQVVLFGIWLWQKSTLRVALDLVPESLASPSPESAQVWVSDWLIHGSGVAFAGVALATVLGGWKPGWDLALLVGVHTAGWALREAPLGPIADWVRRRMDWLAALLLAHLALILALKSYWSEDAFQWLLGVLLVIAGLNLARYARQVPWIYWVMMLALILYTLYINGWWFSSIGDEGEFFNAAYFIVKNWTAATVGQNLFSAQGVYGVHPMFSSLVHAAFLRLLGADFFSWRFSNLYLSALSVGLLYAFLKPFYGRRVALLAAVGLAASHYLMSFGKIGYNNLQALFTLMLGLWAAGWAARAQRPLAFVILGLALGLGFYVYPAALMVLPVPIVFLLFYAPPVSRRRAGLWAVMALAAVMLIFPLLLQPDYWSTKAAGTFFYNPALAAHPGALLLHVGRNWLYALFSFFYLPEESHFVAVSIVDPLTGGLAAIGLAGLIGQVRRSRFAAFWLLSFALTLVLVGAAHDRNFPPLTRLFLFLPWLVVLAALGLDWLVTQLSTMTRLPAAAWVAPTLTALIALNVYQAYPLSQSRFDFTQSFDVLFLRLASDAHVLYPDPPKTFAVITDPSWGIDGFRKLPLLYPGWLSEAQLRQVTLTEPRLTEHDLVTLADPNTLVMIKPWLEAEWQTALDAPLRSIGKEPCEMKTTGGDVRFVLWHAPDLEKLCR